MRSLVAKRLAHFSGHPALWVAVVAVVLTPLQAQAIPYFANQYEMRCQKCHMEVLPGLNKFGRQFLDHGFAFPGAIPNRVFPISIKTSIAYSSNPDPGIPREAVKQIAFILGGKLSPRTSYYVSDRAIEEARPGLFREARFAYQLTPEGAKRPVYLQAGSLVLPLPTDPEMFRETSKRYTIFDQTVGTSAFNLYNPKLGLEVRVGEGDRGLSIQSAVLTGHDVDTTTPGRGSDLMNYVQEAVGPATLSMYRYDGRRVDGGFINQFWRQGYGLDYLVSRLEFLTVLQNGQDSSINGTGLSAGSSGGFTQFRYNFNRKLFGLVRYEGTIDPTGLRHDIIPLLGFGPAKNATVTIEDVIEHSPNTPANTVNVVYKVRY